MWGVESCEYVVKRDLEKGFNVIAKERNLEKLASTIARAQIFGVIPGSWESKIGVTQSDSKSYHSASKFGDSKRNLFIRNVDELREYIAKRDAAENKGEPFESSRYVLGNKLMKDLENQGLAITTTDLDRISLLEAICNEKNCATQIKSKTEFRNLPSSTNSIGTKAQIAKIKYAMTDKGGKAPKIEIVQIHPPQLIEHSPIYGTRSI